VIANDAVTTAKIANATIIAEDLADMGAANDEILKWNGTAWAPAPESGVHTGTTGSIFFADNATGAPTENNAQFFWDATNNRLGLGTTIPSHKLQVVGTIRASGFQTANGLETNPSYRFENDVNTGMFLGAVGELAFTTNNLEAMRIIANQNVGIATTNPTSRLEIGGSFATAIQNTTGGTVLGVNDHTVIFNGNGSITLPAAGSCPGRIYIIKNPSFVVGSNSYNDTLGVVQTSIPTGSVVWLQSTGNTWEQIN